MSGCDSKDLGEIVHGNLFVWVFCFCFCLSLPIKQHLTLAVHFSALPFLWMLTNMGWNILKRLSVRTVYCHREKAAKENMKALPTN